VFSNPNVIPVTVIELWGTVERLRRGPDILLLFRQLTRGANPSVHVRSNTPPQPDEGRNDFPVYHGKYEAARF